jgi:hypothetical protein
MNMTGTLTSVPVVDWRTDVRPLVLRDLADLVKRLAWSTPLLIALLDELHVTEEFDRLIGRLRLQPDRDAPRLLALALFLRHSWDHDDLAAVVNRVLFPPLDIAAPPTPAPVRGDRRKQCRQQARTSPSGRRARKDMS